MDTVLVTGAASGIGRAAALEFADAGWKVVATDRQDPADVDALTDAGCRTEQMDVTSDEQVAETVDAIRADVGAIDCLLNNAGVGQLGPTEDVPIERFEALYQVNVLGAIRCTQAVLPAMRAAGDGVVVNVGSVQGRTHFPGWAPYCSSKHALEGLTSSLRGEVRKFGVDVVLVEPAWVETGFGDGAEASIQGFERSDCYDTIYESLESRDRVDGDRLSVSPERVATTLVSIAESENPDERYAVGLPARLVLLSRFLPDAIYDRLARFFQRRSSKR